MLNLLELILNNNYIYIGIIAFLSIIIILTILSIKKDRDRASKARMTIELPTEEEKARAKLELDKVVNEMQKNLDNKDVRTEIKTYEEEQEEKAIISYDELVAAVRKNEEPKAHSEVGMEVADIKSIEPTSEEEKVNSQIDDENLDQTIIEVDEFLDSLKDFRKKL